MKKMPCLFVRVFDDQPDRRRQTPPTLTSGTTPGCEWVLAGEGSASRKRDGTACAIISGRLYARYDAKKNRKTGEYRMPPVGSIACCEPDSITGHWPYWVEVLEQPEYKWHREAWAAFDQRVEASGAIDVLDGTYELCGPKLQGNPEKLDSHVFIKHGVEVITECPRDFAGIREFLATTEIEGIVFAHEDGRYAKIRRDDFGLDWPPKRT